MLVDTQSEYKVSTHVDDHAPFPRKPELALITEGDGLLRTTKHLSHSRYFSVNRPLKLKTVT